MAKKEFTKEEYAKRFDPVNWDKRNAKVLGAIENGALSYRKIASVADLTIQQVQSTMKKYPDTHGKYFAALQVVKGHVTSNMTEILTDKEHPKNLEATKYFMSRYKTDYDDVFEKPDEESYKFDVAANKSAGISINFTKQSKSVEDNDD